MRRRTVGFFFCIFSYFVLFSFVSYLFRTVPFFFLILQNRSKSLTRRRQTFVDGLRNKTKTAEGNTKISPFLPHANLLFKLWQSLQIAASKSQFHFRVLDFTPVQQENFARNLARFGNLLSSDRCNALYKLYIASAILAGEQSWALSVFFNFFNNKKWFFAFFIKLITYFCTSSI